MAFNMSDFVERVSLADFEVLAMIISQTPNYENVTPHQFMQSANRQMEICDRVIRTGNPERLHGQTEDGYQEAEINIENADDYKAQASSIFMYGLIKDFLADGNIIEQYASADEAAPYIAIVERLMNGDNDDNDGIEIDQDETKLDTKNTTVDIHEKGPVKPDLKLTSTKKINTKGWWN